MARGRKLGWRKDPVLRKSEILIVRLEPAQKSKLRQFCRERQMTISEFIRQEIDREYDQICSQNKFSE